MNDKEQFLSENGYYISSPSGNSMRPFIRGGRDLVTVLPQKGVPRLFDAVLYKRKSGEHVIHRIVAKKKGVFLIRGDNCYYTESVPAENVIGTVHTVRRGEKEISTDTFSYRLMSGGWHLIYPVRFVLYYALRGVKKIGRLLGGKTEK